MNEPHGPQLIPFSPEYAPAFEKLNRQWIEQYFVMEEADRTILGDPYRAVLVPGGQIYFLIEDGQAIGTCAVIRNSENVFELAKMAVSPDTRGKGYGDLLLEAAVDFARNEGARTLMLVSNSRLTAALQLYSKHGFHHVPVKAGDGYDRVDVKMELDLKG